MRDGQFGGEDSLRAAQLNAAFASPEIRAVWVLRGGYGCGRILDALDGGVFRENPTWIVGFSDVTALHMWAAHHGTMSLHAPMASTWDQVETSPGLNPWELLKTEPNAAVSAAELSPVVGGNLSVIYSLLASPFALDLKGKWLMLEDLDEYLYHVDRMMNALRLTGAFDSSTGLAGLVIGGMTQMRDNTRAFGQESDNPFGRDISEIIVDHARRTRPDLPIIVDAPFGHGDRNSPLVLGADIRESVLNLP